VTAGEWRGPQRREYSTTDPDLMREVIGQVYGGVVLTTRNRNSISGFALTQVDAGSFTANSVTLPGELGFRVRGQGSVLVTTVVQGTLRAEWAKDPEGYRPATSTFATSRRPNSAPRRRMSAPAPLPCPFRCFTPSRVPSARRPHHCVSCQPIR
jgi:hypothetical protein